MARRKDELLTPKEFLKSEFVGLSKELEDLRLRNRIEELLDEYGNHVMYHVWTLLKTDQNDNI